MENTLININGTFIDVRFISSIEEIVFDHGSFSFNIRYTDRGKSIRRNIEEDYNIGDRLVIHINKHYPPEDKTYEHYLKYYAYRIDILIEIFPITYNKMVEKRQEIIDIRNRLINQDDSVKYINMEGFNK